MTMIRILLALFFTAISLLTFSQSVENDEADYLIENYGTADSTLLHKALAKCDFSTYAKQDAQVVLRFTNDAIVVLQPTDPAGNNGSIRVNHRNAFILTPKGYITEKVRGAKL